MYLPEIAGVCWHLGFIARKCVERKGHTFRQLTDAMQAGKIKGPVIVLVEGHYLALSRWKFVDSDHRTPRPHAEYRQQRKRVVCLWFISPRPGLDSRPTAMR